ncbi:MAG: hypothetical protein U1C12_00970 [Patescibacteria group bacterium]|nr:hypothetical protein [Patescibacteria group bacterium]
MRNGFEKSTYDFWEGNRECWWCGLEVVIDPKKMIGERVDALHHILGRVSNSIYNSAPIHNFSCHLENGKINKRETIKRFLKKTADYLAMAGYQLKQKDIKFLKYADKYKA